MSGSHYDANPTRYDPPASDWLNPVDDPLEPDVTVWTQRVMARLSAQDDAIAQLSLRLDNRIDAVEAQAATLASRGRTLTEIRSQLETIMRAAMNDLSVESHRTELLEHRVTDLEREVAALREAMSVHADLLQHYRLQEGI